MPNPNNINDSEDEDRDKPLALAFTRTNRGFPLWEFTDFYGVAASLQESSIAYPGCIWLGADQRPANLNEPTTNLLENYRLHLSREQVKSLLPILVYFAEYGYVPDDMILARIQEEAAETAKGNKKVTDPACDVCHDGSGFYQVDGLTRPCPLCGTDDDGTEATP